MLTTAGLVAAPLREARAQGEGFVYVVGGLGAVMLVGGAVYPIVTTANNEPMETGAAWVYTGVGGFMTLLTTIADPAVRAQNPTGEISPWHAIVGSVMSAYGGIGVGGLLGRPRDPWVGASVGLAGFATLHATGTLLGLRESRDSAMATAIAAGVGGAGALLFGIIAEDRGERIGLLSAAGVAAAVTGYEVYRTMTPDLPASAQPSSSRRGLRLAVVPSFGAGQASLTLAGAF